MSALDLDLGDLLVDPEGHGPLLEASEADLARLRAAIAAGRARRRDRSPLPASIEGAYLAQGGRVAYLIEDGIPNFVIDERLEIDA